MKKEKYLAFIAITSMFLFCYADDCWFIEEEEEEPFMEITVEPKTGTKSTEFKFKAYAEKECGHSTVFWWIKDENSNEIDLGDDSHTSEFNRKFDAVGEYTVNANAHDCFANTTFKVIDNGCDGFVSDDTTWATTSIDLSPHRSYYGLESDSVSYGFIQPTIENICAREHILVKIEYDLLETVMNQVKIKSDVTYAILYEYPFNNFQLTGTNHFQQSASIGLSHIYGDQSGWFFVWFEISFKSHGSAENDDAWLRSNFAELKFSNEYWIYEPE